MRFEVSGEVEKEPKIEWRVICEKERVYLQAKGLRDKWCYVLSVRESDGKLQLAFSIPDDLGLDLDEEGRSNLIYSRFRMNLMDEVGSISRETFEAKKKEDKENNLVPKGKWEGVVFTYNLIEENEKTAQELIGKRVYSVGIKFFDCPEFGKAKTGFFKMTPDEVLTDKGGKSGKYATAIDLVGALDAFDVPFTEALEQAKVTRLRYQVNQFKPEDKDVTYCFLRGVSVI
jgi:hypothetical protein